MEEIFRQYQEILHYTDPQQKIQALNNIKTKLMQIILDKQQSRKEIASAKEMIKTIALLVQHDVLDAVKDNVFFARDFEDVNKSLDLMYNATLRSDWVEDTNTRNTLMDSYESLKKLLLFLHNNKPLNEQDCYITYFKYKE